MFYYYVSWLIIDQLFEFSCTRTSFMMISYSFNIFSMLYFILLNDEQLLYAEDSFKDNNWLYTISWTFPKRANISVYKFNKFRIMILKRER